MATKRRKAQPRSSSSWRKTIEGVALSVFKTPPALEQRTRTVRRKDRDAKSYNVTEEHTAEVPPQCPSEAHRVLMLVEIADLLAFFKDVVRPILPPPPMAIDEATPRPVNRPPGRRKPPFRLDALRPC